MGETTVYLIRHGLVQHNFKTNPKTGEKVQLTYGPLAHLSEDGRDQIGALGKKLNEAGVVFDTIYTSIFQRAKETAQIIGSKVKYDRLHYVAALSDIHCPGWWGVPSSELQAIKGNIYSQVRKTVDQESMPEGAYRAITTIREIVTNEQGKTIGIVSHGDIIAFAVWAMEHPQLLIASDYETVVNHWYPQRGEAQKLTYDTELKLISREQMSYAWTPEGSLKGKERE